MLQKIVMESRLVSIITPSFNCSKYIRDCISSVLSQTYDDWEMIITDDCSTDDTIDIINEYVKKDSRITLYTLSQNSGAGVARNNSIKHARGRYIAFLDSDDKWMPEKLEKQIAFMQKNKCVLSYTSRLICNEENEVKGIIIAPKHQTFFNNICDDKIGFSTMIYDTKNIGKMYMPTIRKRQDWCMVIQILKKCKTAYGMKEPLSYYRKGQQSLSKEKSSLFKYNLQVYQEMLKWPKILAFIFFCAIYMPTHIMKKIEIQFINR